MAMQVMKNANGRDGSQREPTREPHTKGRCSFETGTVIDHHGKLNKEKSIESLSFHFTIYPYVKWLP